MGRIRTISVPGGIWPGVEDRPADLGSPQRLVSRLVAADDVELTQWPFDAQGVVRHDLNR
jgi:hypothetical protein